MLLEKANVKRSGAISMGMDGLNNAVIPGHATPEQYTKEITIANDGIVNQKAVLAYAAALLLDDRGARPLGRQVPEGRDRRLRRAEGAPPGHLRAADAEGRDMKKALYRQLRRAQVLITNRFVATRLLTGDGRPGRRRDRLRHPHAPSSWSSAPRP